MGEKFSLPSNNISHQDIFDVIKYVECNIRRLNPEISHQIRNHTVHFLNDCLSIPSQISPHDRHLLKLVKSTTMFLAKHPEFVVTRADKGNTTVVLDRDTYLEKMNNLLSDTNTYSIIKSDPMKKIYNKLNILLNRWKQKGFISEMTLRSLLRSDGVLPRAYGLPKIHKTDCPLKIIVSSIDSPLYCFATYLHNILHKNLPVANSHIANSFELVNLLNDWHVENHLKLISLDVVSLFTH